MGCLGLSLYAHHLKSGTNCSLESFCEMIARTVEDYGGKKYWYWFRPLS